MTDLNVKVMPYNGPLCETGRHYPPHPGDTCEETDEWIALRDAWMQEQLNAAIRRELVDGELTGIMRGVLSWPAPSEPTPIERALDILRPHLAREPLYRASRKKQHGSGGT